MPLVYKTLLSTIAIILTLMAFIPYIVSTIRGKTRPHVFSWIIWGTTTLIVFFAQRSEHGGMGAWVIGISGAISASIAILALLKRTDTTITRIDWIFFLLALSSIPLWFATSDAALAVIVLTTTDLLGFGPTVRKTYYSPHSESLLFFSLFAIRNVLAVFALENFTLATVLFPAALSIACTALIIMTWMRRRVIPKSVVA